MYSQGTPTSVGNSVVCFLPLERTTPGALVRSDLLCGFRRRRAYPKPILRSKRRYVRNSSADFDAHSEVRPTLKSAMSTEEYAPGSVTETEAFLKGSTFENNHWRSTPVHPSESKLYTLKSGESLGSITTRLGKTVPEMQALNPGVAIEQAQPGQTIVVESRIPVMKAADAQDSPAAETAEAPAPVVRVEAVPEASTPQMILAVQAPAPQPSLEVGSTAGGIISALMWPTVAIAGFAVGKQLLRKELRGRATRQSVQRLKRSSEIGHQMHITSVTRAQKVLTTTDGVEDKVADEGEWPVSDRLLWEKKSFLRSAEVTNMSVKEGAAEREREGVKVATGVNEGGDGNNGGWLIGKVAWMDSGETRKDGSDEPRHENIRRRLEALTQTRDVVEKQILEAQVRQLREENRTKEIALLKTLEARNRVLEAKQLELGDAVAAMSGAKAAAAKRAGELELLEGQLASERVQSAAQLASVQSAVEELAAEVKDSQASVFKQGVRHANELAAKEEEILAKQRELRRMAEVTEAAVADMEAQRADAFAQKELQLSEVAAEARELEAAKRVLEEQLDALKADLERRIAAQDELAEANAQRLSAKQSELDVLNSDMSEMVTLLKDMSAENVLEAAEWKARLTKAEARTQVLEKDLRIAQVAADRSRKEAEEVRQAALQERAAFTEQKALIMQKVQRMQAEFSAMQATESAEVRELEMAIEAEKERARRMEEEFHAREAMQSEQMAAKEAAFTEQKVLVMQKVQRMQEAQSEQMTAKEAAFAEQKVLVMQKVQRMEEAFHDLKIRETSRADKFITKAADLTEEANRWRAKHSEVEEVARRMTDALQALRIQNTGEQAAREVELYESMRRMEDVERQKADLELKMQNLETMTRSELRRRDEELREKKRELEESAAAASRVMLEIEARGDEKGEEREEMMTLVDALEAERGELEGQLVQLEERSRTQLNELEEMGLALAAKDAVMRKQRAEVRADALAVEEHHAGQLSAKESQLSGVMATQRALEAELQDLKREALALRAEAEAKDASALAEDTAHAQALEEKEAAMAELVEMMNHALEEVRLQTTESVAERENVLETAMRRTRALEADKLSLEAQVGHLQGELRELHNGQAERLRWTQDELEAKEAELRAVTAALEAQVAGAEDRVERRGREVEESSELARQAMGEAKNWESLSESALQRVHTLEAEKNGLFAELQALRGAQEGVARVRPYRTHQRLRRGSIG
ncbi:hypothetical protein CYMTET_23905 [Cymbomonas tetramitiformis]|uniref:LysM domain-containing protein n=1 Tax=Cymbomonas tetramitiformis TaxID=36881 RepID=A0AAE0FWY8_9CHLO|nr:hypothetical protein CYMTET_23905 [Cymbomonas tetramitiformis]